jgi:hypothetical protein
MTVHDLIDELYAAFADRLGDPIGARARDLPRALKLAPEPDLPWSRVFSHEVTLGAPALFAEAMPGLPSSMVREATLVHLLAVVDAFGTDRLEDQQIDPSPGVLAVLGQLRRERDRAMARLFRGPPPADLDFSAADVLTTSAIHRERATLLSARSVDVTFYERASLDKQCAGLVASVALARVAGWDRRRCIAVRKTLESVALGLQMYDDVVDWEDDLRRGGSWAVCLMMGERRPGVAGDRATEGASIRIQVLHSAVLGTMLVGALAHMRAARRRASALGAFRLAAWAASRERRLEALVSAERRSAGYAVRAHALAAWAGEVLA